MTDLSVIVVTYNSSRLVDQNLSPLIAGTSDAASFVVVDNASCDDTVAALRRLPGDVKIVAHSENTGFAAGVNIGATHADAPFILLLNPDCTIEPLVIEEALAVMRSDSSIGILAPLISHPTGRLRVVDAGQEPTIWRLFCHYFGLSRLAVQSRQFEGLYLLRSQVEHPQRDVSWVSGACMFVRSDCFDSLGGLTERWFMYAEDIDLCLRARAAGYRTVLRSDITALHEIGGSSAPDADEPPIRVSSAWLVHLFELYVLAYRPNRVQIEAWRFVGVCGMLSRAAVYWLLGCAGPRRASWFRESFKFRAHARALMRHPVRYLTPPADSGSLSMRIS